jgi:hypothetical protein
MPAPQDFQRRLRHPNGWRGESAPAAEGARPRAHTSSVRRPAITVESRPGTSVRGLATPAPGTRLMERVLEKERR